jgi:hypothetical protein
MRVAAAMFRHGGRQGWSTSEGAGLPIAAGKRGP